MAVPGDSRGSVPDRDCILSAAASLGFDLNSEQVESIAYFLKGTDVFVSLPTGFGKSLCYILLPKVFDLLRGVQQKSIVLVISPLIALMEDQVAAITALGISAVHASAGKSSDYNTICGIRNGNYQIVFLSPEALFCNSEWRRILSSEHYKTNLVGLVVDEAHCVKKWGESFRKEFSNISEIRSILSDSVHLMALTATATISTRKHIIDNLCMQKPAIVYVPPVKNNITYVVVEKPKAGISAAFQPISKAILSGKQIGRILIFCRSYDEVIKIFQYFKSSLGQHFLEPPGSPNYVCYRVVDMFTRCTHNSVKKKIVEQFTTSSTLRVVIATIAFGMGINCPDIRQIIHWGVPQDAEAYIQESGRAGRDGMHSVAIVMQKAGDLDQRYTSGQMIEYCRNQEVCRREILYRGFPNCKLPNNGCLCCDVCKYLCECSKCDSTLTSFHMPGISS